MNLLIVFCVCTFINGLQSVSIELIKQPSVRHSLHRLPPKYHQKVLNLFKPKPQPQPKQNESVALYRYMDVEFFAKVGIGKPVRYFNLAMSTVWGNTWVISDDCAPAVTACWFHNRYDGSKSSAHVDNGTIFNAKEGKYNITGFFSIDTLQIAHLNVSNFMFAEISSLPWTYLLSKADGVLGMSKLALTQSPGSPPFFYQLFDKSYPNHLNGTQTISIYINRDRSSPHGGNIFLGGIESHYNGTITYVPIISKYYWQFQMTRIVVDVKQKSFPFCVDGCDVMIDTSSNSITGPSIELKKINRLIKAKPIAYDMYEVDCDLINILPAVQFIIAGKPFILKGPDYIQKIAYHGIEICVSSFQPTKSPVTNSNTWTLGGAFLSAYYTTIDVANDKIGFAIMLK